MKFSDREIEIIAYRILRSLKRRGNVVLKTGEAEIRSKIAEVIIKNQEQEMELDREVEELLSAYQSAFDSGQMDYHKMFQMAKKKLAKEKGFIL